MIDIKVKDSFFKKYIILFITLISILTIISKAYINSEVKKLQQDELMRYANVIGILKENNIDEDIIKKVIKPNNEEVSIKNGLDILNKYAYSENIKIENNKWFGQSYKRLKTNIQIVTIINMAIITLVLGFLLYIIIGKVSKLSLEIKKLSEGEYTEVLEENKEGVFPIAYHRFNILSFRMRLWIDELENERESIKKLLNELSHQLKTPIASIKMNNELILDGYVDKSEMNQFLVDNKENIVRLQWITEGLLKLAALEIHCIQINKREENIKNTVLGAINAMYGKAISEDILINVKDISDFNIEHDVRWSKEAIINILDNAIKYSNKNSEIVVSMKNAYMKTTIIIEDNGIGIDKDDLYKIFERFYRSLNNYVQAIEGSGLGLYLCKKIIEEQGGTINVKSEINKGTIFEITLYKHIIN
ncbi:MAG: HAMP domain-containing sensor histidine kinase [Clostridium sp.]|uniref:sensor histidine kinase n=1 Tax=Clostridium sp. TaxID=1506 RepID=UPI002FCBD45B